MRYGVPVLREPMGQKTIRQSHKEMCSMTLRRAALIHKALLKHPVSEGELVLFPCPCSSSRSLPLLVT